jgi:hypothetical protein
MKRKTGKWLQRDLKVRWFCVNCWQKGLAGISMHHKAMSTDALLNDLIHIIRTTCHTNCHEPNIKLHYDIVSLLIH